MSLYREERARYVCSPTWELQNVRKALTTFGGYLNTDRENARLAAVKDILRERRTTKRRVS